MLLRQPSITITGGGGAVGGVVYRKFIILYLLHTRNDLSQFIVGNCVLHRHSRLPSGFKTIHTSSATVNESWRKQIVQSYLHIRSILQS